MAQDQFSRFAFNPKFTGEIFVEKQIPYGVRGNDNLFAAIPRTNDYGLETFRYIEHPWIHTQAFVLLQEIEV